MKKIEREVQRTEVIVTFEAMDGERFNSEDECRKYEESIRNTIKGKYAALTKVNCGDAACYVYGASSEDELHIVHLSSENDVNIVNAYLDYLYCGTYPNRIGYEKVGSDILIVDGYDHEWGRHYGTIEEYLKSVADDLNKFAKELHQSETESEK